MILFIPLIPILAIGVIASGVATLIWYANLSSAEQRKADETAMKMFGKRFKDLDKDDQDEVKDKLS